MTKANFDILEANEERVVLRDLGPWDRYLTITNAAEEVVEELVKRGKLNGRRLLYYDSEGELTELVVEDGKFAGYKMAEL